LREIKQGQYQVQPIPWEELDEDLAPWLEAQAREHGLTTLLVYADDGVIWGLIRNDKLITARDVFGEKMSPSPPLRMETLQQARLFGPAAEVLLWRAQGGWRARLVQDGAGGAGTYYDEIQILWGNQREDARDGFTLVNDGRQGLRHAPPVNAPRDAFADDHHPLRLRVRHYLATDPETGLLRVALSRLTQVTFIPKSGKEGA
jgi:CRISPR-associated protein (TIGR03984 family)